MKLKSEISIQADKSLSIDTGDAKDTDIDNKKEQETNTGYELIKLQEIKEDSQLKTCKNNFFTVLTLLSMIADPLYAFFLFTAFSAASDYAREELDLENEFWEYFFSVLGGIFTCMYQACDFTNMNPIEEAKIMAEFEDVVLTEQLNTVSRCQRNSIKTLTYTNHSIANTTYLINSTANATSVAYLCSLTWVRWVIGTPATILSVIAYNMTTRAKINNHSFQFIQRLTDSESSMVCGALTSPMISLEVIYQILINAIYRSVSTGYTLYQLFINFFDYNGNSENKTVNAFLIYAATSTFYTTLFSRTLNVHKEFFNIGYKNLSRQSLKNTKIHPYHKFIDTIMPSIRTLSAGVLLFRHGPSSILLKSVLVGFSSLMLMAHNLYVRYKKRLYQTAFKTQKKQGVFQTLMPFKEDMSSSQMFDFIKDSYFKTSGVHTTVTILNIGGRIIRWGSFLGFLTTLNHLVKINTSVDLDFVDLLCIQQLCGIPALENDASFFQDNMIDNIAYYRTKWHIEKRIPHFGFMNSLLKPRSAYPKEYLIAFHSSRNRKDTQTTTEKTVSVAVSVQSPSKNILTQYTALKQSPKKSNDAVLLNDSIKNLQT